MIVALLLAAAPVAALPAEASPQICKTVSDHPLKSKRSIACGTAEEWKLFEAALRDARQKKQRQSLAQSSAYAGVASGY